MKYNQNVYCQMQFIMNFIYWMNICNDFGKLSKGSEFIRQD